MNIRLSEYAGACYGVERALALVEDAARGDVPVYTLGPLIHNPGVVAELEAHGVKVVDKVNEVDEGVLVIRSHGVAPLVIDEACARGLAIVDATCPHVLKAQRAARSLREAGCTVVVVGESGHPEVEGISAHAGTDVLVVQTPDDLPKNLGSANPDQRIGVVVQTTQSPDTLEAIVNELHARNLSYEVRDTICSATRQRQQSAQRLAQEVDVMLVVGGFNSGNTTRLYEICKAVCLNTHHIESPSDLNPAWFASAADDFVVGVTAGASTPQEQIASIVEALKTSGTTTAAAAKGA
ncbi:MAG: 4-hydroxy-3-methylbut-2-enyl diphosphate reductase [Coriobacteriia bacterium]|nr:4-hydroxy-3-methylbut-2-enyl diphosphate reductase [Coriobacteriia bacterium]